MGSPVESDFEHLLAGPSDGVTNPSPFALTNLILACLVSPKLVIGKFFGPLDSQNVVQTSIDKCLHFSLNLRCHQLGLTAI